MNELLLLLLRDAFWSAVAALGFAVLFNVPRRTLSGCAIGGAIGHALRTLLMTEAGWTIELATLISAAVIGFLGEFFARRWRTPVTIFTVPGVIPMVPGSFAFGTMISLLELTNLGVFGGTPVLVEASVNFIKTGLILGAIAGGIAAPSLLFQRRRPVI